MIQYRLLQSQTFNLEKDRNKRSQFCIGLIPEFDASGRFYAGEVNLVKV